MFGTGKIGFWSLMEEGIGIVAGSLPALRPLLSIRVGFRSSLATPGAVSGNTDPLSRNRHVRSRPGMITMDTFHQLDDNDDAEHDDGDSQKNIVKQTKYTVTSSHSPINEEEQKRSQVLGWEQALKT